MIKIIINNGSFIVYIHTNIVNGKRYAGITSQKPEERWRRGKGYKHCVLFYKAILKYGWDMFEHEIFAAHLTKEEAENMEVILIKEQKTQDGQYGYNLSDGGHAPSQTEETKQKISITHMGPLNPNFGKKKTEAEKQNLREKMSGVNNHNFGKHLTKETREKISATLTGRPCTMTKEQQKNRAEKIQKALKGRPRPVGAGRPNKKIICLETGEVFESIAEAARQKGIASKNAISRVAKGKQQSCYGYTWEYFEEIENQ